MAITDTTGNSINNSNNLTSYTTAAFTPAAGDILLMLGGITDTAVAIGISDSQGMTWTNLIDQVYATSAKMFAFVSETAAAASSMTVTLTCTGDAGSGCIAFVRRVAGGRVASNHQRQASYGSGASSTTPTVVMGNPVNTNNAAFGAVFNSTTTSASVTPPSSWSELFDVGHATPTMGAEYATRLSGETGSTITWGSTSSTDWGALVVEMYAVGQPVNIPLIMHHRKQMED